MVQLPTVKPLGSRPLRLAHNIWLKGAEDVREAVHRRGAAHDHKRRIDNKKSLVFALFQGGVMGVTST
jgi:hypothetical protein